jgi:hypothetical protein
MTRRIHASIVPVSWALVFGFAIAACDSRPPHRPVPSVAVDSRGIREALRAVYRADGVLQEIDGR